jgi:hypothetical protein
MKTRCQNPRSGSYQHYGGRGIQVCARWQKFENFLKDMGARPEGHQIDRIDVNGNYEPNNCRWVTQSVNARNKRDTKYATIDGVTKPTSEWASDFGIPNYLVAQRMRRDKCSPEEALTRLHGRGPEAFHGIKRTTTFVQVDGERMPLSHACRKLGLNYKSVFQRIKRDKIDPQDALVKPMRVFGPYAYSRGK